MFNKKCTAIVLSLFFSLFAGSALAEALTLDNCKWELTTDTDQVKSEQMRCYGFPEADSEPFTVAVRAYLKELATCHVAPINNDALDLQGDVTVKTVSCHVYDISFQAYPETRMIDGVEETLLSCEWQVDVDNENATIETKYCYGVDGELIEKPVGTRVISKIVDYCGMITRLTESGSIVPDGKLVVGTDLPPQCNTGPIYFRPDF